MNSSDARYITPGSVISLNSLVFHLSSKGALQAAVVHQIVSELGLLGGTLPVSDGIKLGTSFGILDVSHGVLRISDYCEKNISKHCLSDEPTVLALRAILFKVLSSKIPAWLAFFVEDDLAFRAAIPDQWTELFDEAELLDFTDDDVLTWWRNLLGEFHESEQRRLKEIGDVGERLTVEFEKGRIVAESIPVNPLLSVIWVARISNHFGYDVKSVCGERFKTATSEIDIIKIEVKSSVIEDHLSFRFRLTRNEWREAETNLDQYYFYCWTGISPNTGTAAAGPFVIPARTFVNHIPINQGDLCEWSECAFVVNLDTHAV